ncbi:hybrid sensor histidine kinase/response regulator [Pseudoalteromonas piscicida]|uniref:hybrid sensor histidine kinase/response regulator n=1 Tax=Pseudoalteromonas piscicida TaxID=43662 RepID=UPI0030A4DB21
MKKAEIPNNEEGRLRALREYKVLDTTAEANLDEITQLVSEICETPIALISLIDSNRQWFKSKVGLDVDETHRDISFCSHAILQEDIFEVQDALEDERFFDNPLVTGGPKIRHYAGAPLISSGGYKVGTICAISDKPKKLTELQRKTLVTLGRQVIRQLELRREVNVLKLLNDSKDSFLSDISHELHTQLNAVIGFNDVVLNSKEAAGFSEATVSYLQNIEAGGSKLLSVIDSVLELELIEGDKVQFEPTPCSLPEILKQSTAKFATDAKQRNIKISSSITGAHQGQVLHLDKNKLARVLDTLLDIALKSSESGQEVMLRAFVIGSEVQFIIKDSGRGLSATEQTNLFDRFSMFEERSNFGAGLSLCVTKSLIEIMNGRISVSSQEGEGTEVVFIIPCVIDGESKVTPPPKTEHIAIFYHHIGVIEDNPLNQLLITAILDKLNCSYDVFESAEDYFEAAKETHFDMIFMDVNLPGMNGTEAAKLIKQENARLPILAITADIFLTQAQNEVFDNVIHKPYKLSQIETALSQFYS